MLIRAIVVTGPQVLLSLLVVLGLSLLVYWINFVLSEDWNKFWVIEVEGSVVACAKLCRYNTYSVLYNVMVAPEWRRYGLGSALVYHLSQVATKPLYLACYPKRITFYTKLGFVQIRPQDLSPLLRYDLGLTPRVDTVPLMFK
jgi:N-acetylglutamate synthase-like GNAT family acetyltransferase